VKQGEVIVKPEDADERLDTFLAKKLVGELSRSQVKILILSDAILVNGQRMKPHTPVRAGDRITVEYQDRRAYEATPEAIPLVIPYEDKDLLVVDKPAGMVVHPAHANLEHTLVNALLYHVGKELPVVGDSVRPGIVHRLDKETSGLLVVAKNSQAHAFLANQFKQHLIERRYHAVVKGVVQHDEMKCEEPVGRSFLDRRKVRVQASGSKDAVTYFKVLRRFKRATLIEARPWTGRTHQIRVHLSFLGYPVMGDLDYGVRSPHIQRHALHAKSLGFTHPRTKKWMIFESELPEDIQNLLSAVSVD
jgi:23S rRNA pseudouridine1911/1915/1917 synthase